MMDDRIDFLPALVLVCCLLAVFLQKCRWESFFENLG